MLERLVKLLEKFGYEYTIKETNFNTHIIVDRVTLIICDHGIIVKLEDDYSIAINPYEVIDLLDCVVEC